ncbi:MAG: circularly permuted type 2 ATP-grasp protein, partial [Mycobacterium sp.]
MSLTDHDTDDLLLGYHPSAGYDEFVDPEGHIRPAWQELGNLLAQRGRDGMDRLRGVLDELVDADGITYIKIDGHGETVTDGHGITTPGPWHLDGIPLLLSAGDWEDLEAGIVQRSRLLDAVLADIYGEQRALTTGILPPQLVFGHPGYLRTVRGVRNPGRHQLFMLASDISRGADGRFAVNADWTQAPSGAGYAL